MGPNDASRVIWALGELFFIFLGVSLCFTVNTHCNMPIMTMEELDVGGEKIRPK